MNTNLSITAIITSIPSIEANAEAIIIAIIFFTKLTCQQFKTT